MEAEKQQIADQLAYLVEARQNNEDLTQQTQEGNSNWRITDDEDLSVLGNREALDRVEEIWRGALSEGYDRGDSELTEQFRIFFNSINEDVADWLDGPVNTSPEYKRLTLLEKRIRKELNMQQRWTIDSIPGGARRRGR